MTDELLREVDEDIRRERYERLWNRFGNYIVGAALGAVVLTGAWQVWRQYDLRQREALGERYVAALDAALENDRPGAIRALAALAGDGGSGYATLARMQQAALLSQGGDIVAALAAYDALAQDRSTPPAFRDLAIVLSAYHAADRGDVDAVVRRAAPVNTDGNPWRHLAREAIALAALRSGDTERARTALKALSDDFTAPSGIRGRAAELLAALDA